MKNLSLFLNVLVSDTCWTAQRLVLFAVLYSYNKVAAISIAGLYIAQIISEFLIQKELKKQRVEELEKILSQVEEIDNLDRSSENNNLQ